MDAAGHVMAKERSVSSVTLGLTSGRRGPVIVVSILRFLASPPAVDPIGQLGGGPAAEGLFAWKSRSIWGDPLKFSALYHSGSVS
jgi:hypothetical protein